MFIDLKKKDLIMKNIDLKIDYNTVAQDILSKNSTLVIEDLDNKTKNRLGFEVLKLIWNQL